MRPQCASDSVGSWFGGAGSECQPSKARSVVVKAGGPSPVPMMSERAQSNASRTSPR